MRLEDNRPNSGQASLFKEFECSGDVVDKLKAPGEDDGVLNGKATSLTEVGCHRVRSVSHERHTTPTEL